MTKTSKTSSQSKPMVTKKQGPATSTEKDKSIVDIELRIITKMAERYHVFGVTKVKMADILKFAGFALPTFSRFHKTKKLLMEKGDMVYLHESKSFSLTKQGLARAPQETKPSVQTNQEFHSHLKESFESPKAAEMLDLLADGRQHQRSAICRAIGYKFETSAGFAISLKELRKLRLLQADVPKGMVQLSDNAFLPNCRPPCVSEK